MNLVSNNTISDSSVSTDAIQPAVVAEPKPATGFGALGLEPRVLRAVQDARYSAPTPIQSTAIPQLLLGQDLIGIAQTGTGKTAAFVLPILSLMATRRVPKRGIRALILAPTRELVVQIEASARAYSKHLPFRIATAFGGVHERPQIEALRRGADILVATPGRLLDYLDRDIVDFSMLEFLVLDEADRMLDMGFLPSIREIVSTLPSKRQTLLFSATLSREIESLTRQFQQAPKLIQAGERSKPAETVNQVVYEVSQHQKIDLLVNLLRDPKLNTVLVFSRTKYGADKVASKLEQQGTRTATMHSNRSQNQRLRALKDFKTGKVRVLVATDIAARGIDVQGISHVVNYDFPMHPEDYVHRIGRTGRAKQAGDAISFVAPEDRYAVRCLERFIGRSLPRKRMDEPVGTAAPAISKPRQSCVTPVPTEKPQQPMPQRPSRGPSAPARHGFPQRPHSQSQRDEFSFRKSVGPKPKREDSRPSRFKFQQPQKRQNAPGARFEKKQNGAKSRFWKH